MQRLRLKHFDGHSEPSGWIDQGQPLKIEQGIFIVHKLQNNIIG